MGKLTARAVAAAKSGRYGDGQGLWLAVAPSGAKKWVFRFTWQGRVRETGLGSATLVTLAQAREKAHQCRLLVAQGINPVDAKRAAMVAAIAPPTFGILADELFASKRPGWRSEAHATQWQSSMRYAAALHAMPIDQIGVPDVLRILQPIWTKLPETASRVRGRIEAVLDYGKARGLRSGENPAAWKGNLSHLLSRRPKLAQAHFPAMQYADVPRFVASLRTQDGIAPRAVEFLILTAARRSEILGAHWDEIDPDQKIWTLPPLRTKTGTGHRIPLSGRACEILAGLAGKKSGALIFAGPRPGRPISIWSMTAILPPGATLHGFRSSFRDWCGEETNYPREVAEQCLAHSTGSAVERAYRRGDALEKRRQLLESWSQYCGGAAAGNVVAIGGARK